MSTDDGRTVTAVRRLNMELTSLWLGAPGVAAMRTAHAWRPGDPGDREWQPMVTEKTQALVEVQPYLRRLALGGTGGDIAQWHGVVRP